MCGVTTACLNLVGTMPSAREQLTNLVMDGNRISMQSLIRKVGHGSKRHDLVGELDIILRTSSSETCVNVVIFGGFLSG